MKISVDDVNVSERLRQLDNTKVDDLVESIKQVGLLQAIVVDTDNNLLAGNHRLQAIKNLGYEKIECKKVNLTEQKNRLVEIDENLIHNDLSIIEKSEHIALKESILEELGIRATQKNNQSMSEGFFTSKELAEEMKISRRKYLWIKQIHRINATARLILKDSVIANNVDVLVMIERLDDGLQLEVAKRIKDGYSGKIRRLIKDIQNEIK